jgi:hypothetical protein
MYKCDSFLRFLNEEVILFYSEMYSEFPDVNGAGKQYQVEFSQDPNQYTKELRLNLIWREHRKGGENNM